MSRAKVLLVEDDWEWINGLKMYFAGESVFEIVSCVDNREACMAALEQISVDVVLMDIILGDANSSGLDAALDIAHKYPSVKVISKFFG